MLNPTQKLNSKIFDKDVEQVPIRKGFGDGLVLAGEADKNVVGLCADLTESTQMHLFKKKFPDGSQKISYAFRLVFQSGEKTLSEEEINKLMSDITGALNSREGWKVR